MTTKELETLFEKHEDEHLKFERIDCRCNFRRDLRAFVLLDQLVPGSRDIISNARHDEIFLDVELADLAAVVTEEQVVELIRCGVRLSEESLCMFA